MSEREHDSSKPAELSLMRPAGPNANPLTGPGCHTSEPGVSSAATANQSASQITSALPRPAGDARAADERSLFPTRTSFVEHQTLLNDEHPQVLNPQFQHTHQDIMWLLQEQGPAPCSASLPVSAAMAANMLSSSTATESAMGSKMISCLSTATSGSPPENTLSPVTKAPSTKRPTYALAAVEPDPQLADAAPAPTPKRRVSSSNTTENVFSTSGASSSTSFEERHNQGRG